MSVRAWEAILTAWSDMDARVAASLPSGAGVGEAGLRARMDVLHDELSTRLLGGLVPRVRAILTEEARQKLGQDEPDAVSGLSPVEANALVAQGADDEVEQMIAPLAIHVDERVLGRLPPELGPSWTRLQEEVIHSDDGGAVFYQKLDALLASPHASPLVLEVYLFCLCEGFFGRYIEEPERIAAYKDRIARRLPAFAPVGAGAPLSPAPPAPAPPRVLPAPVYYLAAVVAAVVVIFVLHVLVE